jgi:hypothetical protein
MDLASLSPEGGNCTSQPELSCPTFAAARIEHQHLHRSLAVESDVVSDYNSSRSKPAREPLAKPVLA